MSTTKIFIKNKSSQSKAVMKVRRHSAIQKTFKYVKLGFAIVTVLTLIIATVYFIVFSEYLKINSYEIRGTVKYVNHADLLKVTQNAAEHENILFLNTSTLAGTLQNTFQGAKQITIQKKYPKSLVVEVIERVPVAIVVGPVDNQHFLLDTDGYVLGIVDKERLSLPEIYYQEDIKVGYFINKDILPVYLELLDELDKNYVKFSSMSFYRKYVRIYLESSASIWLDNKRSIPDMVAGIAGLIRQSQLEGKDIQTIDLRYEKVFVSYR